MQVPWVLENPYSSFLWKIPQIASLASASDAKQITVDLCAYGTAWRKRTHLLFRHVASSSLQIFAGRMCAGRGLCSFSNKKHVELTGPHPTLGIPWTRVAQPYPKKFARDLGLALMSKHLESG